MPINEMRNCISDVGQSIIERVQQLLDCKFLRYLTCQCIPLRFPIDEYERLINNVLLVGHATASRQKNSYIHDDVRQRVAVKRQSTGGRGGAYQGRSAQDNVMDIAASQREKSTSALEFIL